MYKEYRANPVPARLIIGRFAIIGCTLRAGEGRPAQPVDSTAGQARTYTRAEHRSERPISMIQPFRRNIPEWV